MVPALLPFLWPTLDSGLRAPFPHSLHTADPGRFAEKLIRAQNGETGIVEPTFVYLPGVPGGDAIAKETGCDFFSVPVELGVSHPPFHLSISGLTALQPSGAEKAINVLGDANEYEQKLIKAAIDGLKGNIAKGIEFAQNPPAK